MGVLSYGGTFIWGYFQMGVLLLHQMKKKTHKIYKNVPFAHSIISDLMTSISHGFGNRVFLGVLGCVHISLIYCH